VPPPPPPTPSPSPVSSSVDQATLLAKPLNMHDFSPGTACPVPRR
jgi:hypothetical protein